MKAHLYHFEKTLSPESKANLKKLASSWANLSATERLTLQAVVVFGDNSRARDFIDGYNANQAMPVKFRNRRNYNSDYGKKVFAEARRRVQHAVKMRLI